MTVIEAMKQTVDDSGNIVIPVGGQRGETDLPGTVPEAFLREKFGSLLDLALPITLANLDGLKAALPDDLWAANWDWYAANNVIPVQG